jgi:hypothetical protein
MATPQYLTCMIDPLTGINDQQILDGLAAITSVHNLHFRSQPDGTYVEFPTATAVFDWVQHQVSPFNFITNIIVLSDVFIDRNICRWCSVCRTENRFSHQKLPSFPHWYRPLRHYPLRTRKETCLQYSHTLMDK